jgi:thiamine biosynthesis lipoprotein
VTDAVARWPALGTTASVRVSDPDALPAARAAVERELAAIDLACSRFRSDSDLNRVNGNAGQWTAPAPLLWDAIGTALRAAKLTSGLVDPTIGEALVLAGYDRDFSAGLSEPRATIKAQRIPGWRTIQLDPVRRRLRAPRSVKLDLGATAKALAADRAAQSAHRACESAVLVNLGGDIALAGQPPGGGWLVRVTDDPRDGGQLIALHGGGLATSSTTVRRWGTRSHHIIDPRTGSPAETCWRTVSVAAASCVDSNIASTAAIVKGSDADDWLAQLGLPARLVCTSGEVVTVGAWPAEVAA